jgi:hypothetical protein
VEQKTPKTKNRSSELIFKEINLIFFKENNFDPGGLKSPFRAYLFLPG